MEKSLWMWYLEIKNKNCNENISLDLVHRKNNSRLFVDFCSGSKFGRDHLHRLKVNKMTLKNKIEHLHFITTAMAKKIYISKNFKKSINLILSFEEKLYKKSINFLIF